MSLEKRKADVVKEGRPFTREDVHRAVMEGAGLRVRPIMMTVFAIVLGLIPIMIGSGTGSEVMQRIAGPMIGGMISTVLLTLLVIPAIFYVWKRKGLGQGVSTLSSIKNYNQERRK